MLQPDLAPGHGGAEDGKQTHSDSIEASCCGSAGGRLGAWAVYQGGQAHQADKNKYYALNDA
ncbi:hypothetical protein GCM10007418_09760 [Halopseudomonas salina]|uniref:Uncharacterized protein n=1 Tax=Halopseudomonas salina TaxID=1323744 RepID=A0ABQ1PAI6_9GAMM|nr:hypothetical protein GCM10007418_09760 [Halopseudomonas salina]